MKDFAPDVGDKLQGKLVALEGGGMKKYCTGLDNTNHGDESVG